MGLVKNQTSTLGICEWIPGLSELIQLVSFCTLSLKIGSFGILMLERKQKSKWFNSTQTEKGVSVIFRTIYWLFCADTREQECKCESKCKMKSTLICYGLHWRLSNEAGTTRADACWLTNIVWISEGSGFVSFVTTAGFHFTNKLTHSPIYILYTRSTSFF